MILCCDSQCKINIVWQSGDYFRDRIILEAYLYHITNIKCNIRMIFWFIWEVYKKTIWKWSPFKWVVYWKYHLHIEYTDNPLSKYINIVFKLNILFYFELGILSYNYYPCWTRFSKFSNFFWNSTVRSSLNNW